jgi:hypothetical protein
MEQHDGRASLAPSGATIVTSSPPSRKSAGVPAIASRGGRIAIQNVHALTSTMAAAAIAIQSRILTRRI